MHPVTHMGYSFGFYDSLKPVVLVGALHGSFIASFLLGWAVTTAASLAAYPLDTVRYVAIRCRDYTFPLNARSIAGA